MVDEDLKSYHDPGDQNESGAGQDSLRCSETIDMFAPTAHNPMRQGVSDAPFNGDDYSDARDRPRLSAQIQRVYDAMADGEWHSIHGVASTTGDPETSVARQIRYLRAERFGGHTVERRYEGGGLYLYRLEI